MQVIVDEITSAVLLAGVDSSSFIHGRSWDSALQTALDSTLTSFVYLDPLVKTGVLSTGNETYSVSIGFIRQDARDSSPDEMALIIDEMDTLCISFLTILFNVNILDDGSIMMFDSYNIIPIYRIKNVCSGVLCTFDVTINRGC